MNNGDSLRRDRGPLIAKIALLLVFVLGIGIIYAGTAGRRPMKVPDSVQNPLFRLSTDSVRPLTMIGTRP